MRQAVQVVFGARGQLVVGVLALGGSIAAWIYGARLHNEALIRFLFHVSMAALVLASYAIIATALGYRAAERIEENLTNGDVPTGRDAGTPAPATRGPRR